MGDCTPDEKRCSRCGRTQSLTEFRRRSRSKDGLRPWCNDCYREYQREWQKANPKALREYKRQYRETHREQVRDHKRKKYHENIERSREQQRLWRELNPDKVATRNALNAQKRRWSQLLRTHGLTPERFLEYWRVQNGLCAICRRQINGGRVPRSEIGPDELPAHVDHDHATGLIRGLLCPPCNAALGLMADDVERLHEAIRYLQRGGSL